MADHVRKRIRDDVISTLTGLATTGSNVFPGPFYPVGAADLPGLAIKSGAEESEPDEGTIGVGGQSARAYNVIAEIAVQSRTGMDDEIDKIAVEVEEAMATDRTRGGLALDTVYQELSEPEFLEDQRHPTAFARITWQIDYRVPEGDPDTAI